MHSASDESIAADAPYSQFEDDDIAHGWDGTCPWSIDKDGTLTLWEGTPVYTEPVDEYLIGWAKTPQTGKDWNAVEERDGMRWWRYGNGRTPWSDVRAKVKEAVIRDEVTLTSAEALFFGLENMTAFSLPDMSQVGTAQAMFDGCISLVSADLSGVNMSECTSLQYAFRNCLSLRWVYLSDLDTKNVATMRFMFQHCDKLVNVDLSHFDTTSIEDMTGIFYYCSSLESVDLRNFKLPKGSMSFLDSFGQTFMYSSSIKRLALGENSLSEEINCAGFATQPPTTYPYTGKWVNEDIPSVVLTTDELVVNYPNDKAPVGTYVWQVVNDTAQVSFDANGGESAREPVVMREAMFPVELSADAATRAGHKLIGWNTERDGSGMRYPVNFPYMPVRGQNVTMYAQWVAFEDLAPLNYVINGYDHVDRCGIYEDAAADDLQGYHLIGSEVALTDVEPKRDAHRFLGWASEPVADIAYLDDGSAEAFLASEDHVESITMADGGVTVYAAWQEAYPRKIINGDFEYPRLNLFPNYANRWLGISIVTGKYEYGDAITGSIYDCMPSFNKKLCAWESTYKSGEAASKEDGIIEIQREINTDNQYSDLAYGVKNSDVYQDILTAPCSLYKWRISQCSNYVGINDILNVKIGDPNGDLSLQDASRTTQNSLKNPLGPVGSEISTPVAVGGNFNHQGQWERYEGFYLTGTEQYVTRFLFKMANNNGTSVGCLVDDIEFAIAYSLSYNLNGGSSTTIYADPVANNYQGYHLEGDDVSLPASTDLTAPDGLVFLGWTAERTATLTAASTQGEKDALLSSLLPSYKMPARAVTLYAAYAEAAAIEVTDNGGGSIGEPVIVTPDGKLLPTGSVHVVPNDGFKVSKILLDGNPIELPGLNEGEGYTLILENLIGKHKLDVTFADMRIQMPETGQAGIAIGIAVGAGLVIAAIIGIFFGRRKDDE